MAMVLPNKHLPLDRSLLCVGGEILRTLSDRPRSVSSAWEELRAQNNRTSFEQFTLAASLLFALGAVELEGGNLRRNVA
jgi:hypothetical protein